jgi:signal transduction histidine kinase
VEATAPSGAVFGAPPRDRRALVLTDALVAVAVALPGVVYVVAGATPESAHHDPVLTLLAILLASAPLAFRRVAPLATLAAILVVGLVVRDRWEVTLPALVAVYTIATMRSRRDVILITGFAATVLILAPLLNGHIHLGPSVQRALSLGIAAAIGLYVGTRRRYMEALRQRADQLERERELLAREAVAEERVRIARELHDVVAHHISVVIVEAQAREGSPESTPEADATLHRIAQTAREALTEMHRMLGLLRLDAGTDVALAPQPGIQEIGDQVEQARRTGVDASLAIEGEPRSLAPAVELSAYRIVQEALTNVRKHATPARARVTIHYGESALELDISDDGAPQPEPAGSGHGLVGMRERAALFGGTLEAGPDLNGGFTVRAVLPLEEGR